MAILLDGRALAGRRQAELQTAVGLLAEPPCLATLLVGGDADSERYLNHKLRACRKAGMTTQPHQLPHDAGEAYLLAQIDHLNADASVDGILVQLPLPSNINSRLVLDRIAPEKDVDGLTTFNRGRLAQQESEPLFFPPTPLAVLALLAEAEVDVAAKHAVVVGRSDLVGLPLMLMLARADATVTLCHSRTQNLAHHTRRADIVVSAAGVPGLIDGSMLAQGSTVVDVGLTAVADKSAKSGYRLAGDVDQLSAQAVAAHLTPVPGGVGPMTVVMLLTNVLEAATRRL